MRLDTDTRVSENLRVSGNALLFECFPIFEVAVLLSSTSARVLHDS